MTEDQSEDEEEGEDGLDELGEVLKQYGGLLNKIAGETVKQQLNAFFGTVVHPCYDLLAGVDMLLGCAKTSQQFPIECFQPLSDKEKVDRKTSRELLYAEGLLELCQLKRYLKSAEGKEEIVKNFEQNRKEWIETTYNGPLVRPTLVLLL